MCRPTVEQFAASALAFLEKQSPRRPAEAFAWGVGSDRVSLLSEKTTEEEGAEVADAKAWKQREFDAGFGWITGPVEYGGRGLTREYEQRYRALKSDFALSSEAPFGISLGMVAPTILAHGTDAAKASYLRALWRGEILGCQLFSEPGAGSDLANVQTRAVRAGDGWVLNGQKVWTTRAHHSEIGEVLTRTGAASSRHRGLTVFVVDMHAPGVEVRPLRQMTGGSSFNEVFFTEVFVHEDNRLGDVDDGWHVALTTLMNERASIGVGGSGVETVPRVLALAQWLGVDRDPLTRQELASLFIHDKVAGYNSQRALDAVRAGQLPGPELSVAKLALTQNMRRTADVVSRLLGPRLIADTGEWGTYAWSEYVLGVPGMRLAGGTDEVMRNIIGERVLGLPKEPPGATLCQRGRWAHP